MFDVLPDIPDRFALPSLPVTMASISTIVAVAACSWQITVHPHNSRKMVNITYYDTNDYADVHARFLRLMRF